MQNPYQKGTPEHDVWERMPKAADKPSGFSVGAKLAAVGLLVALPVALVALRIIFG